MQSAAKKMQTLDRDLTYPRDQGDVLTSSTHRKSLLMNLLQKVSFVRPRSFSVALERENCLDTLDAVDNRPGTSSTEIV